MPPDLLETEAERLETLSLLNNKIDDLTHKLESMKNELMGALNERDEMRRALEAATLEAANFRAVKAIVFALPEKTK